MGCHLSETTSNVLVHIFEIFEIDLSIMPDEAETIDRLLAGRVALSVTGAADGDVVCGRRLDQPTGGVRLKVVASPSGPGCIPAIKVSPEEMESHIGPVSKHMRVSHALARLELEGVPRDAVDINTAKPAGYILGKGCTCDQFKCGCKGATDTARFVILDIGKWREYEGEQGVDIAALDDAIRSGESKSWQWILAQLGIHHLQLRRYLFCVEPRVVATAEPAEGRVAIDLVRAVSTSRSVGWISPPEVELSIHSPPSKEVPWKAEEALAVCIEVCSLLSEECPLPHKPSGAFASIGAIVQACADALKSSTMGELKSAHQKVVRRGVPSILITGGKEKVVVPSWIYAAVCVAQLMVRPNVFDPELGISLRGSVSALKRLAVILCEDAIHESGADGAALEALLAAALLCQLDVDYHPCEEIVKMAMATTARAVWSRHAVEWRRCSEQRTVSFEGLGRDVVKVTLDEVSRARWGNSAVMLAHIKSLSGDIRMMNGVAAHLMRCDWLPVRVQSQGIVNALANVCMPDFTTTDQHCYRGIGSLLRITAGSGSIAEMFGALFHHVTGINPRRGIPKEIAIVEDQPWVPWESPFFQQARLAQWFALHPPCIARQKELPLVPGATVALRTLLYPGELAGGVGHIFVKVKGIGYIVVLGAQVPEDETVMVAPSRANRNVFDVSEDIKQLAIRHVRGRVLKPKHCQHAALRKPVQFVDDKWHLDGIPWIDGWVEQGLESEFVVHSRWDPFSSSPEAEDKLIAEALQYRGDGLVEGATELVQECCKRVPLDVLQRLIDIMQQATVTTVSVPVPGMDGGLAPGALKAPAPQDPQVYRLMAILSRLVPGAMRACKLPQFKIPSSVIFHHLREWVRSVYVDAIAASGNLWPQDPHRHLGCPDNSTKLYPFQSNSVAKMQRAPPDASHFLFASTGSGKTPMAAEHMRLNAIRLGPSVHSVLWVAPKKLVDSTVKLLSEWGYPVHRVVCKKRKRQDAYDFEVKPGMYNVVDVDYLHKVVDDLLPLAPRLLVVVDEVDQCYGATKRTASAFRLANNAMSVLAMTATAIRKDSDPLAEWLNLTEPFPVNSSNYLVSMAKAVNLELDLGITKIKEEKVIPMQPEVRQWCFGNPRDWRGMESVIREATDPVLIDVTVEECHRATTVHHPKSEDTSIVPSGALLVAWNQDHVEKLVEMLKARGVQAGGFDQRDDPSLEVLVVVCRNARGYNSAIRFGCMVTGVYPGNAADRQQMQGRLSRIGQQRRELRFVTVFMKGSILQLLHEKQLVAGNTNSSIQALGEKYCSEILKMAAG